MPDTQTGREYDPADHGDLPEDEDEDTREFSRSYLLTLIQACNEDPQRLTNHEETTVLTALLHCVLDGGGYTLTD